MLRIMCIPASPTIGTDLKKIPIIIRFVRSFSTATFEGAANGSSAQCVLIKASSLLKIDEDDVH